MRFRPLKLRLHMQCFLAEVMQFLKKCLHHQCTLKIACAATNEYAMRQLKKSQFKVATVYNIS